MKRKIEKKDRKEGRRKEESRNRRGEKIHLKTTGRPHNLSG